MKIFAARSRYRMRLTACLTGLVIAATVGAEPTTRAPFTLVVQPTHGVAMAPQGYQALADYLMLATGTHISVVTPPNFLAHWETIRRDNGIDLVLDDAHFTDYRIQRRGYHVLVKVPGVISYSLVASPGKRIKDPLSLTGKKVASFGPPGIGATRLNAMFPNPTRRPSIIEISTTQQGLDLLQRKKVEAAMLPTSAVTDLVNTGRVIVLTTMEPTPHLALSASPRVTKQTRERIRAALLRAGESSNGRRMLENIGLSHFEPASASVYANHARLLRDVWGY